MLVIIWGGFILVQILLEILNSLTNISILYDTGIV